MPTTSDAVYAAILAEAAPIAEMPVALDAELSVSALLGGVYATADIDRADAVRRFAADFGEYLSRQDTPAANGVRAALAAVLPGEVTAPDGTAWTGVSCTGTWEVRDNYGDQSTYLATFRYADPERGGPDHAVSYLLDHNLGIVKSIWIGAPAEQVVTGWQDEASRDPDVSIEPAEPARLRAAVSGYLRLTDELAEPPEGYAEERAFGIARLGVLPETAEPARRPKLSDGARDALVADFLESPEAQHIGGPNGSPPTTAVAWGARAAVDFAVDDNAGDPLRWSPTAVELLLLDWAPRQLSRTHQAAPWLPEVLDAFVAYAGRLKRQSPAAVEATREAITDAVLRYSDLMTGDTLGEPVSDVLARMVADGVDPLDQAAVLEWVLADRARRGAD